MNDKSATTDQSKLTKNAKAFNFKTVRKVTLPLLRFEIGVPLYVKITDEIFQGKEIKGTDSSTKMDPANLVHVTNLETGEEQQIIVATVLGETIKESYPDGSYVGRCFQLIKGEKKDSKQRYYPYLIEEIEPA